ncbi:hypothetical protein DPMN_032859 [Dreissena polymorpha]|uniref:Uncharacterized protein n=1 Tax=Dreissena polymorpha TaxID=45954 RepID=A0A9D4M4R3_DREPO|nr:hypothetical protein DPMN_032859 [Dreissena polymorpha]
MVSKTMDFSFDQPGATSSPYRVGGSHNVSRPARIPSSSFHSTYSNAADHQLHPSFLHSNPNNFIHVKVSPNQRKDIPMKVLNLN